MNIFTKRANDRYSVPSHDEEDPLSPIVKNILIAGAIAVVLVLLVGGFWALSA